LDERPYKYKHLIATFMNCNVDLLDEKGFVETSLKAIERANMKLAVTSGENPMHYRISDDAMGGGVSVNALITTSHLTIHSARKHRIVEFDCATCGQNSYPEKALEVFKQFLKTNTLKIHFKNF